MSATHEEDRRHPRKRFRPVAAGDLDPRFATGLGLSLVLAGLPAVRGDRATARARRPRVRHANAVVHARVAPPDRVRHLRGGGRVRPACRRRGCRGARAPISLVPAGRDELRGVRGRGQALRRAATDRRPASAAEDGCSTPTARRALELIIAGATAVALLAYCMWAFSLPAVRGIPWRPLTIVPFAVCVLRYGGLVHRGAGEAPEDVLLSDRPSAARGAGVAGAVRAGGQCGWLTRESFPRTRSSPRPVSSPDGPEVQVPGSRLSARAASTSCTSRSTPQASGRRLPRGMGRSYGDAAQISGGLVIETTGLKRIEFDAARGAVTAQAGVTIGELLRELVPAGWILPVVPGTQHVTIGWGDRQRRPRQEPRRRGDARDSPRGDLAAQADGELVELRPGMGDGSVRIDARRHGPDRHHRRRASQAQPNPGRDAVSRHRPGRVAGRRARGAGGGRRDHTASRGSTCCARGRDEEW